MNSTSNTYNTFLSFDSAKEEDFWDKYFTPCYNFLYQVNYTQWFTVFIYFGLIITLLAALSHEHEDLFNRGVSTKPINKYNNGASYYTGKVDHNDDLDTIFRKIRISCRHDVASVYWRRSIAFAIIVSFILLILVLQRFPTGLEWIIAVLILYLSLYFLLNWYQHVVSKPACEQVNDATRILECRLLHHHNCNHSSHSL